MNRQDEALSSTARHGFLPEDYLQRRAERRTNLLSLFLFGVVSIGVVGAFLVTNRRWHDVKRYQEAINVRYAQAARDIEQLKAIEAQRAQLLDKAELVTALIEKVPRSILLAELINRMPASVTLLELDIKSARLAEPAPPKAPAAGAGERKQPAGKAARTAPGGDARPASAAPPRFSTKLAIVGVASTHENVARYVAGLQQCALLSNVELRFSEKTTIVSREMNRFRIEAELRPDSDARRIEPLTSPRIAGDAFSPRGHTVGAAPDSTPGDER